LANEMPKSSDYDGLTRKVLHYPEAFAELVARSKTRALADADWAPIEALVDVQAYERIGVFAKAKAEIMGWEDYKANVIRYAGKTSWEGTLRHVTEQTGRVILELEERNTRDGVTDVARTVTIYEFTDAGKLRHLDVYVMPMGEFQAA
jgi:hypothetical protein